MNPSLETRAAKTTADPRWALVLARAPAADGHFVYSVRSTGVFCRPSCGARHREVPRRSTGIQVHLNVNQSGFYAKDGGAAGTEKGHGRLWPTPR